VCILNIDIKYSLDISPFTGALNINKNNKKTDKVITDNIRTLTIFSKWEILFENLMITRSGIKKISGLIKYDNKYPMVEFISSAKDINVSR